MKLSEIAKLSQFNLPPGQLPGMFSGLQTQGAPPKQVIKPAIAGNITGLTATVLTYFLLNNIKIPKKNAKGQKTQVEIPIGIKIPLSIAIGLFTRYAVKGALEKNFANRQAEYLTGQQFGGFQIPQSQYYLPGGTGATTTGAFDPERKAGEFLQAYNPDGWTSDEYEMLQILKSIPPKTFAIVAQAYTQLYGRNLIADADEQLNTYWYEDEWGAYKKQIP
jgi:hypothetical protein